MKYVARVTTLLRPGIHSHGDVVDGELRPGAALPEPDRVEIETDVSDGSCMMNRYTKSGEFCGDTWHPNVKEAFEQAGFEYGLVEGDFLRVE